jgi:hypothetical protein
MTVEGGETEVPVELLSPARGGMSRLHRRVWLMDPTAVTTEVATVGAPVGEFLGKLRGAERVVGMRMLEDVEDGLGSVMA